MSPASLAPHPLVARVRELVEREVRPVVRALEHTDAYPHDLVARMRELGLFGALVPAAYGGLGLDVTTYARIIEELCRGWMSLAGVINSHTMAALIVLHHGTEAQRARFLPRFASGEARGGLCLTEPHAGSDVQAIRTTARRRGDAYVLNGTKMFVTNGREGNTFAVLAVTDPAATPRHRGMSCFVVEKGHPGLRVAQSIEKLGYKGVDTAELVFEDVPVGADALVGGIEGRGFAHVMRGLEAGRINIAARAVGVAQATWENALERVRGSGEASARLGEMATTLAAARLLTYWAAAMKDRGERCDLEAGMAKLYASEAAQDLAVSALRIHGEAGALERLDVERHYRDTPLMIIGEGTNEIQRTLIARQLVERHGERLGPLVARADEPDERREMVLAVRQFVEKTLMPAAVERDRTRRFPEAIVAQLAELGLLGATVPTAWGGLGLDRGTTAMTLEELARGSATVASAVAAHLAAAGAIARFGTRQDRERLLPSMTRGDVIGAVALNGAVALRDGDGMAVCAGTAPLVDNAGRAHLFVVAVAREGAPRACVLVGRDAPGLTVGAPEPTLGLRGLDPCPLTLDGVRVTPGAVLGALDGEAEACASDTLTFARLAVAATGLGVAQAAFEAALRYAQQRTTFGKPIAEHQAIQLKLADMATRTTAARLLTARAAADGDARLVVMAKLHASETAYEVAFESMRVYGGYGYTADFPVERCYRDAAHLLLVPLPNDAERAALARRLASGEPAPAGL